MIAAWSAVLVADAAAVVAAILFGPRVTYWLDRRAIRRRARARRGYLR